MSAKPVYEMKDEKLRHLERELLAMKKKMDAMLRRKKALLQEIQTTARALRVAEEKRKMTERHRTNIQLLELAAAGLSLRKIAAQLDVSFEGLAQRIQGAWAREFPQHYQANQTMIFELGLLTALRRSPPLFSSITKLPKISLS